MCVYAVYCYEYYVYISQGLCADAFKLDKYYKQQQKNNNKQMKKKIFACHFRF